MPAGPGIPRPGGPRDLGPGPHPTLRAAGSRLRDASFTPGGRRPVRPPGRRDGAASAQQGPTAGLRPDSEEVAISAPDLLTVRGLVVLFAANTGRQSSSREYRGVLLFFIRFAEERGSNRAWTSTSPPSSPTRPASAGWRPVPATTAPSSCASSCAFWSAPGWSARGSPRGFGCSRCPRTIPTRRSPWSSPCRLSRRPLTQGPSSSCCSLWGPGPGSRSCCAATSPPSRRGCSTSPARPGRGRYPSAPGCGASSRPNSAAWGRGTAPPPSSAPARNGSRTAGPGRSWPSAASGPACRRSARTTSATPPAPGGFGRESRWWWSRAPWVTPKVLGRSLRLGGPGSRYLSGLPLPFCCLWQRPEASVTGHDDRDSGNTSPSGHPRSCSTRICVARAVQG